MASRPTQKARPGAWGHTVHTPAWALARFLRPHWRRSGRGFHTQKSHKARKTEGGGHQARLRSQPFLNDRHHVNMKIKVRAVLSLAVNAGSKGNLLAPVPASSPGSSSRLQLPANAGLPCVTWPALTRMPALPPALTATWQLREARPGTQRPSIRCEPGRPGAPGASRNRAEPHTPAFLEGLPLGGWVTSSRAACGTRQRLAGSQRGLC